MAKLGEYQNPAIMQSMPLEAVAPSASNRTSIESAVPFILLWADLCHTVPSGCPMEKVFLLCYCTRKRENWQGKNPKASINLQLKTSSSSLSQASGAVEQDSCLSVLSRYISSSAQLELFSSSRRNSVPLPRLCSCQICLY